MTTFREFIKKIDIARTRKEISKDLDLAGLLVAAGEKPIRAEVKGCDFDAVCNVFPNRENVCRCLGCSKEELIPKLVYALNNPKKPELVEDGAVLENECEVDLDRLPIPVHAEKDGGPYIASAIVIANDPELGRNLSFHRMMVIGKDRVVARILDRHLKHFIDRAGGELDVAIIIGSPINVLLCAAISSKLGQDELEYANALAELKTVRLSNGIEVPAECEMAFEAKITKEMHDEGPFIDLTLTYDIVRKQQVIKLTKMYHRNDALFHVLLPGGPEHKVLMGMPREPTIFNSVNEVCKCRGVNITPGGCSWLHAVVSIKKENDDDGKKAIEAAFRGHKSLKHCVVVDDDIDIDNPSEVEWAVATRFQADRDLVLKENEKGSSLDPSADPHTYKTTKMGLDATVPLERKDDFQKAEWKKIDVDEYI